MKFSLRMFRQMVLHVLYLEKENGNVPYHLPEIRVVLVEKQMKRSIFSGTCNSGQMVLPFFPKTFHRDEPFHLNSLRNYRNLHSNVRAHLSVKTCERTDNVTQRKTKEQKKTSNNNLTQPRANKTKKKFHMQVFTPR